MKNVFRTLVVALLLLPAISHAQSPVLTNLMISPIEGESYLFNNIDNIDSISVGTLGENQVWDYSGLTTESIDPLNYINTDATMNASYFPGANVASADQNMCMFEYYHKSGDRLSYVGIYMDGLIMHFDDNKDALQYPFEYGDSFTDTFSTTYEQSSAVHHRNGTINAEADAYGTLMLPWGTLEDVLRVKTIEEMTDTFTFNNIPFEYNYYYETYAYYKPGIREPVLEFMYSSINEGNMMFSGHYINETQVNSIVEIPAGSMELYPNPVINELNIATITASPIHYCSITDIDGKLVWEDKSSRFIGGKTMDVGFLKAGVYFLQVVTEDEAIIQKFIKN